jgi:hypothetical protein
VGGRRWGIEYLQVNPNAPHLSFGVSLPLDARPQGAGLYRRWWPLGRPWHHTWVPQCGACVPASLLAAPTCLLAADVTLKERQSPVSSRLS